METTNKVAVIQALRGVAAMLVVLWHASMYLGPYGKGIGGALFTSASAMGVDLFFVLSGLIMVFSTRQIEGGRKSAVRFLIRRFSRVWPVYLVATLVAIALWPDATQTAGRFLYSMSFIPMDATNAPAMAWPSLPVGWTLNYEMYFYLVFGLSILAGKWRWAALFSWLALTTLVPAALAGNWVLYPRVTYGFDVAYFALAANPIVLLFAAGALIGLVYCSRMKIPAALATLLAGVALACFAWQYAYQFRTGQGPFDAGLSVVPLAFFTVMASKTVNLRVPKPIVYLGEISFSLYLFHPSLITVYSLFRMHVNGLEWMPGVGSMVIVIAASILAAAVSHKYLELGLSEWVRRRLLSMAERSSEFSPAPFTR